VSLILVLRNTSNLAEVSDYDYKVLVGDGTPERSKTLARGVITGHRRSNGWQALVRLLLDKEPVKED
jgi:hypothetical protein